MKKLRLKSRTKRLFRIIVNTLYILVVGKKKSIVLNVSMEQIGSHVVSHNVGDDINYYLVKSLSGKTIFNYVDVLNVFRLRNIMCIGSIIDWMTTAESIVWGSGVRDDKNKLSVKPYKVLAVRGPLTRQYLLQNGVDCPAVYGDPALLLPKIYPPHTCLKKNKIGIILHKNDVGNIDVQKFIKRNDSVALIDIKDYQDWHDVVDNIQECELILSSSLHGIIISDAYGIPNVWIKFSDETFDGSFKYLDYLLSVGRSEREPLELSEQNMLFENLYKLKDSYSSISFDSKALLSVCPFALKKAFL